MTPQTMSKSHLASSLHDDFDPTAEIKQISSLYSAGWSVWLLTTLKILLFSMSKLIVTIELAVSFLV